MVQAIFLVIVLDGLCTGSFTLPAVAITKDDLVAVGANRMTGDVTIAKLALGAGEGQTCAAALEAAQGALAWDKAGQTIAQTAGIRAPREFVPGRLDHHSAQILLTLAMLCCAIAALERVGFVITGSGTDNPRYEVDRKSVV